MADGLPTLELAPPYDARAGAVLKQGILTKRAVRAKHIKPWRSRRIVLRKDRIEWYKIGQTEGMQGCLLIDGSSIVDPQLNGGRLHSFSVTTDGATLALIAANSAECGEWLEAVQARVRVMKLSGQEHANEQGRISYVEHQQSASDSEGENGAPATATQLETSGASGNSGALGTSAEASTGAVGGSGHCSI